MPRVKNNLYNEINHPNTKENIMNMLVKILVGLALALGLGFLVRAIISHFDTPVS